MKKNQIYIEKEIINNILHEKSFEESLHKIYEIINNTEEYAKITINIIKEFLSPYLKNLTYYLDDDNIEKTTNKIENMFQKMFSKHDKKNYEE